MVAVSWSMGPPLLRRRWFRDHLDRVARALLKTDRAAGAFRVIEPIALARTELDDRRLRTGGEAVVAFKAIAATQAALRLAPRLRLGQAGQDLGEAGGAVLLRQLALRRRVRVAEQRQVQHREVHQRRSGVLPVAQSAQPG